MIAKFVCGPHRDVQGILFKRRAVDGFQERAAGAHALVRGQHQDLTQPDAALVRPPEEVEAARLPHLRPPGALSPDTLYP